MAQARVADETADETAEGTVAKKGGKKMVIIVVIAAVVLLAGLGGGAYLYFSKASSETGEAGEEAHADQHEGKKKKVERAAPVYVLIGDELSPFVVNLAGASEADYLQVEVQVLVRDPHLQELIKLHMPALKAKLGALFSQQDSAEIKAAAGREQLRMQALGVVRELLKAQSDELTDEAIEDLFFTNFVMQ